MGRLRESNSSFLGDGKEAQNPVNRWKQGLTHQQIVALEGLIGGSLQDFGYPLTLDPEQRRPGFRSKCLASVYPRFLSTKLWLKVNTPLGRFSNLSALELPVPPSDAD